MRRCKPSPYPGARAPAMEKMTRVRFTTDLTLIRYRLTASKLCHRLGDLWRHSRVVRSGRPCHSASVTRVADLLGAKVSITPRAADPLARRFAARNRRSARRPSDHCRARSLAVPCATTAPGHRRTQPGTRSMSASGNLTERAASHSCRKRGGPQDVCAVRADETPPAHRGELPTSALARRTNNTRPCRS